MRDISKALPPEQWIQPRCRCHATSQAAITADVIAQAANDALRSGLLATPRDIGGPAPLARLTIS